VGPRSRPTFTLQALAQQTPDQRAAVVAEGEHLEAVDAELVRHVDAEPLRTQRLQEAQRQLQNNKYI